VDLTPEIKRKIVGENAARIYGIDIASQKDKLGGKPMEMLRAAAA
jgi:hypothetical protein